MEFNEIPLLISGTLIAVVGAIIAILGNLNQIDRTQDKRRNGHLDD